MTIDREALRAAGIEDDWIDGAEKKRGEKRERPIAAVRLSSISTTPSNPRRPTADEILAMYRECRSMETVGKAIGRSPHWVSGALAVGCGFWTDGKPPRPPEFDAEAARLRDMGHTLEAIAEAMGRSRRTIADAIKRHRSKRND